jgi:predicted ABC-type ATPase
MRPSCEAHRTGFCLKPLALFYAGCNGAGKSSLRSVDTDLPTNLLVIDPDAIAREICPANPRSVDLQAGRQAIQRLKLAMSRQQPFSLETTLTGASVLSRIRAAKDAGYYVELRYVGLACVDLNIERVAHRVAKGGHAIELESIKRRYEASLSNLPTALQWVNNATVWDNSYASPKLHLIVMASELIINQLNQPEWITKLQSELRINRVLKYNLTE